MKWEDLPEIVTRKQYEKFLNVSPNTFVALRRNGKIAAEADFSGPRTQRWTKTSLKIFHQL